MTSHKLSGITRVTGCANSSRVSRVLAVRFVTQDSLPENTKLLVRSPSDQCFLTPLSGGFPPLFFEDSINIQSAVIYCLSMRRALFFRVCLWSIVVCLRAFFPGAFELKVKRRPLFAMYLPTKDGDMV